MRIIAGEFKGRKLLPPDNDVTRPVTDRVKQSLFDILMPNLPGAVVYDCFAGTGSMGLECLSRGAKHVTFFEAYRPAADRLRKNIQTLGVNDRATVIGGDLFKWFGSASKASIDLIFLDPPYRFLKEQPEDLLKLAGLVQARHLSGEGVVVFRHDAADQLPLPPLHLADVRNYGSMTLEFLTRQATVHSPVTTEVESSG